jgi:hypothetical protein
MIDIDLSEWWSDAALRAIEIVRVVLVGPDAGPLEALITAEDIIRALEAEGFLVDPNLNSEDE